MHRFTSPRLFVVIHGTPVFLLALLLRIFLPLAHAQNEPEKQKEGDWVDARWNRTDLGRFHSAVLAWDEGKVAKGFAVRLGTNGGASVAYDLAQMTCRLGWEGSFLKFEPGRYGLIGAPHPGGEEVFSAPRLAWGAAPVQWRGLHTSGERVVLDYDVAGGRVLESPWWESAGNWGAFTRTLEITGGRGQPMPTQTLLSGEGRTFQVTAEPGLALATLVGETNTLAVAVTGDAGAKFLFTNATLQLVWPTNAAARRVKIFIALVTRAELPEFAKLVRASPEPLDLVALARPASPVWSPLTTRGQRGFGSEAYVVDTLTVPYENPWHALFFTSGVDFLPNGDAAVCTIHGDVWLVSGIDDKLEKLTWRRFATGLHQPLGLRVRDGKIYVLGRDQITCLHDENDDGAADFYENFFNGITTSTGGHDYVTSLDADAAGNFYYVDPRGAHRVSADGTQFETIAAGWRNPNGLGVSPDGKILLVAPQEGNWTPSSAICEARPGGWYGYGGPRVTPERPLGYDEPLCWIPHAVDNSSGSQLWVTSDRWGLTRGHFIHFSFGRCAQFLVLREVVGGTAQGAITPLPGRFLSGAMRGAFHPRDGQLYVVGSRGWQTSALRDGCLQRVRYTGATAVVPVEFHAHTNGLRLIFSTPLDRAAAEDPGAYAVSAWNYRYAERYGSKDWSPSAPNKEGRDTLEVKSVRMLTDGRGVFLEIPALQPVMQFEVKYSVKSADQTSARNSLWGSIHKLGAVW